MKHIQSIYIKIYIIIVDGLTIDFIYIYKVEIKKRPNEDCCLLSHPLYLHLKSYKIVVYACMYNQNLSPPCTSLGDMQKETTAADQKSTKIACINYFEFKVRIPL